MNYLEITVKRGYLNTQTYNHDFIDCSRQCRSRSDCADREINTNRLKRAEDV